MKQLMVLVVLLMYTSKKAASYDPLDPNGNITVTFDVHQWTDDGYMARVTIQNYYQYRHVEKPGWKLGWTWTKDEVIWSMKGALATKQGNCSSFGLKIPHCCQVNPIIVDLTPEAAPDNWSANCCRSGLLAAQAIDPPSSLSSFEVVVGNLPTVGAAYMPVNLTLLAPYRGYTCSPLVDVPPTIVKVLEGQREEQVFRTWRSACTYSSFVANESPSCCVSLSTFYNPKVMPCPACVCGCSDSHLNTTGTKPVCNVLPDLMMPVPLDLWLGRRVECTDHMCPVQVHWHVKSNYRDNWRVRMTVSNYNMGYNYTDWNLVVQHPGFTQPVITYSFNSAKLITAGDMSDAAIFWGLKYYNEELLQVDDTGPGSVTTDVLLGKDQDSFTLSNGWPFPRRVYFNGGSCAMEENDYPQLPNTGSSLQNRHYLVFCFIILMAFV